LPELPDVELFKGYIDSTSLHKTITGVKLNDSYALKDIDPVTLKKKLAGQNLAESRRHGKYLFLILSDRNTLLLHFGMTGYLRYFKNDEEKPDYTQLLLTFDNGYCLAYSSKRKLGEIRVVEDPDTFISDNHMGPDALDPNLNFDIFSNGFEGRRGMVKPALMNQEIIAGIGNEYSDEILFQARIHPKTQVPDLEQSDLKSLYNTMQEVLTKAIDCRADKDRFPDHFLLHNREEDAECPGDCGGTIQTVEVSGRTAYFCPDCQEKK
jgi:formamidopyrimidine-DNA glycosylase